MHTFRLFWLVVTGFVLGACATVPTPVRDPGHPAVQQLVDLRRTIPSLRFDVRYATRENFTGQQLYPVPAVWLHRDAAQALMRVQQDLQREGLRLKVFDGYRPYHVQQRMWDLIRDERYVSNPAKNAGRHTRGTAVDVTLVDWQGREVAMPTDFDDFTEKAHRNAQGIPEEARANSLRLEQAMARHGFIPYPYEWWHFDYRGWEKRPPLDVSLTALPAQNQVSSDAAR